MYNEEGEEKPDKNSYEKENLQKWDKQKGEEEMIVSVHVVVVHTGNICCYLPPYRFVNIRDKKKRTRKE
ncbi:hypothetical protein P167DRAFT_82 [Morchella conica CCBAS932]|uniref:Uncharacterized protein n=1 Tax=Morchella conica CCBAS932 TaxID=1392247 RepID=A0A3N4L3L8_9PEZI|nr:hypothetical protein P167DRAFT_82 [Morchella conica CCBAS932]